MKPTKENVDALKRMGFKPEDDDLSGWWIRENWSFLMDCCPNINTLVQRLIRTNYTYGYDDGLEKKRRQYKTTDI